MTTTHIAGNDIRINQLLRQRCAWCGHILIDYNLDNVQVPTVDVGKFTPSTWPVGTLVEVDGGMSSVLLNIDAVDGLPDNACSADEVHAAGVVVMSE